MSWMPSRATVEEFKKRYPKGTRVELRWMSDMHAPPIGTKGTVVGVDDCATVHVAWDNGSHLGAVYGEDAIAKIE